MDLKTWRRRRKSSEKIIVANGTTERTMEEDQDKGLGSTRCPTNLNGTLTSVICDCTTKEEVIRKHARMAEQALAGQQMAEAEAAYLKQELDKALLQGEAAEQRLAQLDTVLKDCMQEMESLRDDQDRRIHVSLLKAVEDFEKIQKKLEGKVAKSNKRVSNLASENNNLMKALLCKEKLIKDLDEQKGQLEVEFDMLMATSDAIEKENTTLKYECSMMEKFKLRQEVKEHSHISVSENAKPTDRLEAESQQLHDSVGKSSQGLLVASNMKNEDDVRGGDQASIWTTRLNPTTGNSPKKVSKGTSFLIDRVYNLEEENKTLREIVSLSDSQIQSWRIKCGRLASRLAQAGGQLRELSEGERSMKLAISSFGVRNDDRIDDSETWAKALLAEVEEFRKGDRKNEPECQLERGIMNDLIETEKFAMVTTGIEAPGADHQLQSTSRELVIHGDSNGKANNEPEKCDSWLDEVLKVILEEHQVSRRSFGDLLEEIRIIVGDEDDMSKQTQENCSNVTGLLPWKSSYSTYMKEPTPKITPSNGIFVEEKRVEDASFAREKIRKQFGFDRSKSENQLNVAPSSHNTLAQMIKIQTALQEENRGTREKLQLLSEENVALGKQLQESKQTIETLRKEVDTLKESKGVMEEQIENQRLINEDLDTQLTVAKAKWNEILHKLSSLEVELEDKNNSCEELEATCLELQLQLEIMSRKESPNTDIDQVAKKLKTDMIQDLGKQLNALASPDTILFDKVFCPATTITAIKGPAPGKRSLATQHFSLRDRMLAEDDDKIQDPKSSKIKEESSDTGLPRLPASELNERSPDQVGSLALVPRKKPSGGFGFIRKLFLRRKRGCSKTKPVLLKQNTSTFNGSRDLLLVV